MHKINTINDTIHFRARSLKGTDVCKSHAYGIPTSSQMISEFKPGNQYHSQYSGIQYMYVHMYGCRSVRISSA